MIAHPKKTWAHKLAEHLAKAKAQAGAAWSQALWVDTVNAWAEANPPKSKRKAKVSLMSEEEWIESLERDPAMAGVDVRREIGKCQFWCRNNEKVATRRRIVVWLGRCDRSVKASQDGRSSFKAVISSDIYTEPQNWRTSPAAQKVLGVSDDSWGLVCAKAWLDLSPDIRKDIIRGML